jgi:hypothetical protein
MKLESKPVAMLALYLVTIAVGLLLMWLARDFAHAGSNVMAAFLLGCMLSGLGVLALLVGESRTIELDERRRRIVLDVRRRVGAGRRIEIPFTEIMGLAIGLQGKASSGTRYYDLMVRLKSGTEIYLFGGCVFEGRMSRQWIDDLKSRFEKAIFAP